MNYSRDRKDIGKGASLHQLSIITFHRALSFLVMNFLSKLLESELPLHLSTHVLKTGQAEIAGAHALMTERTEFKLHMSLSDVRAQK